MTDEDITFTPDESCTTLNLQVFVCSVCGEDHETENCAVVQSLKLVHDSKVLSRARQTLPKSLELKILADGSTTVITNTTIEQGTQFGPFQAPLSVDLHPAVIFPLKVFGKSLDEGYYLDTTDEELCNWMCLVATATTIREQNLICYDVRQNVYFTTTKDVQPGEELRVWYALYYGLKLQALPLADDSIQEESFYDLADDETQEKFKSNDDASVIIGEELLQTLAQHLPAHALGASGERDVWICKLCGMQESNVASYARHLMTHYRQEVNDNDHSRCQICRKRFLSPKMLEKHLLKSHNCEHEEDVAPPSRTSQDNTKFDEVENLELSKSQISGEESLTHKQGELTDKRNPIANTVGICADAGDSVHGSSEYTADFADNDSLPYKFGNDDPNNMENGLTCMTNAVPLQKIFLSKSENLSDEKTQNPGCSSELSQASPTHVEPICLSEQNILASPFQIDGREQVIIQSDSGESFSTTLNFCGTKDIDTALANGEPITFIMVESSEENETLKPSENSNICDGILPPVTDKISKPVMSPSQTPNPALSEKQNLPYNCDICQKSFGKCSYLYRHLRKHTGEFTCVTCLAVFARKENLKTHSCSQPKEWFPCPTCGKKFSAKKYLQRHTPMHTGEFSCPECKRNFVSRLSLKFHRCNGGKLNLMKATVSCFMCERAFDAESKLHAHLKVHSDVNTHKASSSKPYVRKPQMLQRQVKSKGTDINSELIQNESTERKEFICEVCGATFKSSSSMKTHTFLHGERKFECDICKKRFHRKDVLQEHLRVHQEANFPCQICGKKYKTKKSLYVHSLIHKGSKRFACGICGKEFFQKGNLFKHVQTHTTERMHTCHHCNKSFSSKEYFNIHVLTHTQGKIFRCDACKRSFVKKHLLDAHRQLFHSNRGFLCKFCNTVIRHRHSVRRHLEKCHSDERQEWAVPGFMDQLLAEVPENLLLPIGDTKLTPKQQLERQKSIETLRKKHFQNKSLPTEASVDTEPSSDFTFASISSSEVQISQLTQVDPLIMLQPSQQLTLIDNFMPEYDQTQPSVSVGQSLLVSGDVQGAEGEILLTLVDQDATNDAAIKNTTPVLTSAALGSDMIGLDSGASFLMEDGAGSSRVLLYVVETSNGEEVDSEDLIWCSDAVGEQL